MKTLTDYLNGAVEIKRNSVRSVWKNDNYFIKTDRRRKSFKKELATLEMLRELNIPATSPVCCGTDGKVSYMVTEHWKNGIAVADYVRQNAPDAEFLQKFTEFLYAFFDTGLYHGDLHIGNVLYDANERCFALVDCRDISGSFLKSWRDRKKMRHIILELREFYPKTKLLFQLAALGISKPERFWIDDLRRDQKRLAKEWKKREKQVLSGYPKFTEKVGSKLICVNAPKAAAETIEKFELPKAEKIFLTHFMLELARVPHREARWFDTATGEIAFADLPEDLQMLPESAIGEACERFSVIGDCRKFNPEEWRVNKFGVPFFLGKIMQRPDSKGDK